MPLRQDGCTRSKTENCLENSGHSVHTFKSLSRESRHEKSEHGKKQKIPAEMTETEHSSKTSFPSDKPMSEHVKEIRGSSSKHLAEDIKKLPFSIKTETISQKTTLHPNPRKEDNRTSDVLNSPKPDDLQGEDKKGPTPNDNEPILFQNMYDVLKCRPRKKRKIETGTSTEQTVQRKKDPKKEILSKKKKEIHTKESMQKKEPKAKSIDTSKKVRRKEQPQAEQKKQELQIVCSSSEIESETTSKEPTKPEIFEDPSKKAGDVCIFEHNNSLY
ncbi:hypothetical protein TNCT_402921 [Trichonephila clavata]|uniref:Uncharacterized protein n=1 Tax=Trichonephila clavata TaxID=2740835 RepID=A0A8X6I365_TRICU|nr:hypothetical protein TNCT_402921 [Trichonephila clavata]